MTVSFIIPYPTTKAGKTNWSKRYGLNAYYAGKHWSERKKDATAWHTLVLAELQKQKIKRTPLCNPVVITFYWNDRLDCSNHAAMGKMIEDALKGTLIHDDNRACVRGVEHYFHDEDYIRVVLREV